jgi:tetratricopeptide (TPR) repeat protein
MLTEFIKKRIVKSLIGEIAGLTPALFELAGHGLIEVLENKKLIHHGINKDHQFSGYTVDSFSNDSMVVAQYSTTQGYFENDDTADAPRFDKIEGDIASAEKHRKPGPTTKIYLLSSQEEPPSFRAKFNKTDTPNRLRDALIVFDAREIAKRIYDTSIANTEVATFFRQFFGGFSQDLDNFAYYGKLPAQCDHHQSDKGIIDAIRQHFAKGERIAVLHGVSGSGKTQAAIDYVRNDTSFESYIWLASGDWKPDIPLTAVQRSRGGSAVNVVGLFNSAKTILVIDKLDQNPDAKVFEELAPGFAKGGVVLVTSQVALPGVSGHLPMPQFAKDVAIRILDEDPANASETCVRFLAACRFSPLLLSAARKIIQSQNLEHDAFYSEILASPEALDGDDGTSIMRRMLERLEAAPREALAKVAQSGLGTHDGAFLNHFLGAMPRVSLQRLAVLTAANTPGMMSVHDLICKAMRADVDARPMVASIESYIDTHQGEMGPSVLRQMHVSRHQLFAEHERRGAREPDWLAYALLQITDTKQRVFGAYFSVKIGDTANLAALMCLIDAREQHAYSLADEKERQTFYERCVEEYREALKAAKGKSKAELLHHLGKANRRVGRQDESLECFQSLLQLEPEWHATHGQIAHLGAGKKANDKIRAEGEKSIRFLIGRMLDDPWEMPLRVSMAALSNLRSYRRFIGELTENPQAVEALAEVIAMSALEGLEQFYDAFSAFTSMFGYRHEEICINLGETLGDMFAVPPDSVSAEHRLSVCEALTNVALAARRAGNETVWRRISELSSPFADAIVASGKLNPFTARGIAKAYNVAGAPQKALDVIAMVSPEGMSHWILYRKAEAQLALGLPEALGTARQALAEAEGDDRPVPGIASYYDQVSQCLEQAGNLPGATEHARIALERCEPGSYRAILEQRFEALAHAVRRG